MLGESSRSISESLGQQMNNIGQDSRTSGSMATGVLRVRTAAELEAERVCNFLYENSKVQPLLMAIFGILNFKIWDSLAGTIGGDRIRPPSPFIQQ